MHDSKGESMSSSILTKRAEKEENKDSNHEENKSVQVSSNEMKDEEEEERPEIMKKSIQRIFNKLYIGDLNAALSLKTLNYFKIKNVISAMKQTYPQHPDFNYLIVPINDDDQTNISEWFDIVANWIQPRLNDVNGDGVLIHCVAGVSRSVTLLAAYLMKTQRLTADDAIGLISSQRPQVQPNDFFIHQLEMYERCNYEWNPAKHQEQRRFIMNFVASEMKDGVGPQKLILAYYPSPAPSPTEASNLTMTPLKSPSVESSKMNTMSGSNLTSMDQSDQPQTRRRFTKRKNETKNSCETVEKSRSKAKTPVVEKLGQGQVIIQGRRIRCKMCRRELAARDHILLHSPGKGQSAFAPQKQDMNRFRQGLIQVKNRSRLSLNPPHSIDSNYTRARISSVVGLGNLRISLPPHHQTIIRPIDPSNDYQVNCLKGDDEDEKPILTKSKDSNSSSSSSPSEEDLITMTPRDSIRLKTQSTPSPPSPPLPLISSTDCSSYFVEPLSWMSQELSRGEMMGKLHCPNLKCQSKLGTFDWAGCQCSCGAWITPGFQILRSKVDEV